MSQYPNSPTSDAIVVTNGADGESPYDKDGIQVLAPQHVGHINGLTPENHSTLQIGSSFCQGCGERQTEIMIVGPTGDAFYVKLRPSMAILLGELCMIHGKAGQVEQ